VLACGLTLNPIPDGEDEAEASEEVPGELVVRVGTLACARTLEVSEHRLADVGKFGGGIYWPP
jgi:hypothetical protein